MQRKTRFLCSFLCVVSGIILSVAFTYTKLWFLCMFSLIPVFYVVLKFDFKVRTMIKYMLLFQIGYYIPLMMWLMNIGVLLPFSDTTSRIVLWFATILIGIIEGFYICLATAFFSKAKRNNFSDVFIFSLLFVLGEWFMEHTPFLAFPWGKIGVIATPFKIFIQSASLFGGMFISFLILIINGTLAYIIINYRDFEKTLSAIIITGIIFTINVSFGYTRIKSEVKGKPFKAMVVQGNYSGLDKWKAPSNEIFETYLNLTRQGADKHTKLIIWPETAVPTSFCDDSRYSTELKKLSKELDATIVTGFFVSDQNSNSKYYNALMAFSPDGTMSDYYYKQVLAPFGEYFPFGDFLSKTFPVLSELIKNSSGLLSGDKTKLLETDNSKIGAIICYESIFTKMSIESSRQGADILVVASNDSWFGESPALYQHFSHSIMRAVETQKFVARASNTGISAIISPYGEVISSAKPFDKTTASGNVYLNDHKTFYCRTGEIFVIPCFLAFIYTFIRFINKTKQIS